MFDSGRPDRKKRYEYESGLQWFPPTRRPTDVHHDVYRHSVAALRQIRLVAPTPTAVLGPPLERGLTLPAAEVMRDAMGTKGLLVLALSPACRFCSRSMPFYRRLAALDEVRSRAVAIVVASPQPLGRSAAFLKQYALHVDLYPRSMDELGLIVASTPTGVLVDTGGVVLTSWEGMLTQDVENEVVASLRTLAQQ